MKPLEQLNLMLWLVWDAQGALACQGFTLHAIGARIPLDPALQRALIRANSRWRKHAVAPDLLLRNQQGTWWFLECKTSAFGPNSSTAAQAAAMLVLTPRWFAQARGLAEKDVALVKVCYALQGGQEATQQATLEDIRHRLQPHAAVNPAGAFGIYPDGNGLTLRGAGASVCFSSAMAVSLPPEGVYPLLPVDPSIDANDPDAWKDLQERLRSTFVAWMGKYLPRAVHQPIELRLEEDLLRRAILVWDVWEDESRKTVRRRARAFVRRLLQPVRKYFQHLEERSAGWTFQVPDVTTVDTILRLLLGAESRRREMPAQLSLFDVAPSREEEADEHDRKSGDPNPS